MYAFKHHREKTDQKYKPFIPDYPKANSRDSGGALQFLLRGPLKNIRYNLAF